ncbi:uncharacterized protein DDB_G0271670-like [Penaeus indicus]|uniref:uncharacterized protein DDB_G0271670-like n=1 Tax=Penaeus indicus TaxID=29960 RepID=UPI00300D168A
MGREPQTTSPVATVYQPYLSENTVKLCAATIALSVPGARSFCKAVAGASSDSERCELRGKYGRSNESTSSSSSESTSSSSSDGTSSSSSESTSSSSSESTSSSSSDGTSSSSSESTSSSSSESSSSSSSDWTSSSSSDWTSSSSSDWTSSSNSDWTSSSSSEWTSSSSSDWTSFSSRALTLEVSSLGCTLLGKCSIFLLGSNLLLSIILLGKIVVLVL